MSDFPETAGMRSLFPAEPGRWVWSRMKVYLAVLAVSVVVFFLFADWLAHGADHDSLSWLHAIWSMLAALVAFVGWRTTRRELDKQHEHSNK